MYRRYILGMLVEDQPGVLTRITGMFARRGFNIDTITVGKSTQPGVSKIVLTHMGNDIIHEQIKKQVHKLVTVIKIEDLHPDKSIVSELCLIKVCASDEKKKSELLNYADIYKVKIEDMTPKSMTFQVVGDSGKINSFIEAVEKFGIREISRTGITAISRGPKTPENENGRGDWGGNDNH